MQKELKRRPVVLAVSLILLALLTLALSFLLGQRLGMRSANKNFALSIAYLKKQCVGYDDVLAADRVKSLIRLTEQTGGITHWITKEDLIQDENALHDYLTEYMENQRLDGVMILDGDKNIIASLFCDELTERDFTRLLQSTALARVFAYPTNIYADRLDAFGMQTDIAAVHRRDGDGIAVCFRIQGSQKTESFQNSLETLLANDDTALSGMLYITDGVQILGCNREELHRTPVKDQPLLLSLSQNEKSNCLVHLKQDGKNYFGGKVSYDKYTLYVIYPFESIFASCRTTMFVGGGIYLLLLLFALFFINRAQRTNMRLLNRQYETIGAISNIYHCVIRLNFDKNDTSFLRRPPIYAQIPDGLAPRRLLWKELPKHILPKYRNAYCDFTNPDTLAERLTGKELLEFDYQSIRGIWLHDVITPLKYDANGTLLRALLITRNIDEQKQKELAYQKQLEETSKIEAEANCAKTDFLRRISHDTRTPINVINGMLKIAQSDPENAEKQAYCREKIGEATQFLSELVNDILVVNRMETDKETAPEETVVFSLRKTVQQTFSIAENQKTDTTVTLHAPRIQTAHDTLRGNALHFRQILINLLTNATRYNRPGGSVDFGIEEITFSEGISTLRIVCRDTGIGMSPKFQARMFEPFAKEHSLAPASAYESGLGLGLTVVKKLVTEMNGTISVDSAPDKGTVFLITLPFAVADTPQKEQPPLPEKSDLLRGIHVLIAEDNPLNMEVAAFLLEQHGATVTKALSGAKALQLFENAPRGTFDLILMDMMMPPPDGLETTRRIRAMNHPDAKTIPILAMTANLFPQDIAACKEAGMNAHLGKPLDAATLVQTIKAYVQKKARATV